MSLDRYMNVEVDHTRKIVSVTNGTSSSTPTYADIGSYTVGIDFNSGGVGNLAHKQTEIADYLLRCDPGLDIRTDDLITEADGTQYKIAFKHRDHDVPISFANFDIYGMKLMGA